MLEFFTQFSCLLIHFNFLKLFVVSQLPSWTTHTSLELNIPGAAVAMANTAESSHQLGSFLDIVLELSSLDFYLLKSHPAVTLPVITCSSYHLLAGHSYAGCHFFSVKYHQVSLWCEIPSSLCTVFTQISPQ